MKSPAFSFYVRDWMCSRRVAAMSGEQVKAYVYLLCEAWLQTPRATLPTGPDDLASMARVDRKTWDRIGPAIMECFKMGTCEKHSGRYFNELLLEVSNVSEHRKANRDNKTATKYEQTSDNRRTPVRNETKRDETIRNERDVSSPGGCKGGDVPGLTTIGDAAAEAVAARAKQ